MTVSGTPGDVVIRGGDYEHTLGIPGIYGPGIRLGYEALPVQEIFRKMLGDRAFEVCEFSLANYLVLRATGQDWLTALPLFPHRAFRHSLVVTRRDADLVDLAQLAGKRIGVEDYSMTAAVWVRGLLEDEYGVDPASVTWVTYAKQRLPVPAGACVDTTADDLEELLLAGGIDAMLGFATRDSKLPARERRLRPLLADTQAAELAYFQRTGIYPINHCVVMRSDVAAARPELVQAVADAYVAAKASAYQRRLGTTLLPWGKDAWSRYFECFGGDPLPYGLTPVNRSVIGTLGRYLCAQGFIRALPDADNLFLAPACV